MSKTQALRAINAKIDALILAGKTNTAIYVRLVRLHIILISR